MTPLEQAAMENLDLKSQLEHQLDRLRQLGVPVDTTVLSLAITQQRLEQLISYMFDPQEEVSREAFELAWEDTLKEILEGALKDANRVVLLAPPSGGE